MVDPVKFMIPGKLAFSDAAVALLPQINVANNIQVVFTINTFMFFYIISLALRFFQKWQRDENDKAKLEKEKISTELSFLKHQINPHFIFNSLNSIYSLSMSNSKSASESILKLSSILRYMLYQSDKNVCNSTEELTIIDDYIQLQKLRLSDKVSVEYKFIKDSVEYKIEPLIIITLLENAFKYGVDTNSNSFIQILITIINGKLTLKVKNKIVRQIKGGEQHSGIGLKNLQRRLDLVYPNRYSYNYNVDFKNMIYSVFLEINL
ncbi:MAG: histidine kinase [Ignavibacteria bacterium]